MSLVNLAIVIIILIAVLALPGFGGPASFLGSILYLVIIPNVIVFLASLVSGRKWYGFIAIVLISENFV